MDVASNRHTQDFAFSELVVKLIFLHGITCVLITLAFFLLFSHEQVAVLLRFLLVFPGSFIKFYIFLIIYIHLKFKF